MCRFPQASTKRKPVFDVLVVFRTISMSGMTGEIPYNMGWLPSLVKL